MTADEKLADRTVASPELLNIAKALGIGFAWIIVELAPDGILVSDDDGRIMLANRRVEALFGYDRDALVGSPVDNLLPPRFRRAHEAHRAKYVNAPALRPMGADLELFGCHADGSEFPIEVSLSPAATDRGIATVVIIRDVTEQLALRQAARTESALDHDERLAADMHDRVIGRVFGCGLTLASVLGRHELDDRVTQQLYDVLEGLDEAVYEIRDTIFTRLERTSLPPV